MFGVHYLYVMDLMFRRAFGHRAHLGRSLRYPVHVRLFVTVRHRVITCLVVRYVIEYMCGCSLSHRVHVWLFVTS